MLNRAHSLFGDPPASGGPAASGSGVRLAAAGQSVRAGAQRMSALSGQMSYGYGVFAAGAGRSLDGMARTDGRLGAVLDDAAGTDRSGRADSGAVTQGAASDSAALEPISGTPAAEQALIAALRARVSQQQQVVAAYRARDAQLAAMLRASAYARHGGGVIMPAGGGMPWGGMNLGGGTPMGTGMLSGLSGLTGMARRRHPPRASLMSHIDHRGDAVPGGPGEMAARAALTKLGRPYVWGAKGPSSFDCSGLTGWAWRQAGVQLGADTYHQIGDGVAVPPGQVRAGDLIFPKDSFGTAGPGHVQLAISPAQVIHAPQPGDVVRVTAMPSSYVARRPIPLG